MSGDELQAWCLKVGQSGYRGKQLFEWMYRQGISSFEDMSNVNKSFREYLKTNCIIQTLDVDKIVSSKLDKCTKFLFRTMDKQFIDDVYKFRNIKNAHLKVCMQFIDLIPI